ncbi:MAG: ATP phosphoribosyltransferase [Anaerolineaceae bacterium]|nr:MAG: ATP phosphoribosyltransferase [Anaerolineaceae bacterium]
MDEKFTLALPSKGAIAEPTYSFLKEAGLKISKPNPRQYTGNIRAIPRLDVLFQRVKDVLYKVADGTAHVGVTGLDVVEEYGDDEVVVIHPALGYGHCDLMVAVPETWIDVETMTDLVDVALDFREEKRRNLRVATTYTRLTRRFLHANGIHHFKIVEAEGAIEAAPTIGYADIVVDLSQTGTTLRENHLRPIPDGIITRSQACLIGNRRALQSDQTLLDTVRVLLEHIDAALQGRDYSQLTINIQGESAAGIAERIAANPTTAGLLGPTIAPIYGAGDDGGRGWFTATVTINKRHLLTAVEHLREIGGSQIVVQPVNYVFLQESPTYKALIEALAI